MGNFSLGNSAPSAKGPTGPGRRFVPAFLFFIAAFSLGGAENSPSFRDADVKVSGEISLPRETYLIPQTVFVGDNGRLVVSLGEAFGGAEPFILSPPEIPSIPDLEISRIELEKRNNNNRLLVDFIAYAPGSFALPLLEIESTGPDPLILGGLEISVASILTPDLMVLSEPAPSLAVPGTGFMVYGGAGAALLVFAAGTGGFLWARRCLGPFREKRKRRKLFVSLEQRLKGLLADDEPSRRKELFSLLAGEFREFLSLLTGVNCAAFTPREFLELSVPVPGGPEPDFLCRLFRRWDEIRFSGEAVDRRAVLAALDGFGPFLTGLKNQEKTS